MRERTLKEEKEGRREGRESLRSSRACVLNISPSTALHLQSIKIGSPRRTREKRERGSCHAERRHTSLPSTLPVFSVTSSVRLWRFENVSKLPLSTIRPKPLLDGLVTLFMALSWPPTDGVRWLEEAAIKAEDLCVRRRKETTRVRLVLL